MYLLKKCAKKPVNFQIYPKTRFGSLGTGNSPTFDVCQKVYLSGQETVISNYEIVKRNCFWRRGCIDIPPDLAWILAKSFITI